MADELTWLPAWRIRKLVVSGDVSAVEVTDHFLGRIEELDPVLRAFKHVDAVGAREQARQADEATRLGEDLGPLHGIPISVKEHIAVAGMPIMALGVGPDRTARFDDLGVARLRSAGAVIVGTNTMMGTSAPGPGQFNWDREARNPWDPARAPGWSSSGGAATAAARLLPIAIGSDGGGSTRLPGAYSGVFAVHPTAGLVPSYNPAAQVRMNPTGTIGPMARDVTDAAITLQAMAGPDGRDFDCMQATPPDYLSRLDDGVEGLRLAWTDDYGFTPMYAFEESPRVITAIRETTVPVVRSLGAVVQTADAVWEDFWPGYVTTNFLFGGGPTGSVQRPGRQQWIDAMELRGRNWATFRALFADHDLLLSPTSQLLAPTIEDWAARWGGNGPVPFPHGTFAPHYTSHTHMFNWLGFPAVNVPVGFVDGLPVGLQVVGWPGSEDTILRFAQAFLRANPREEHPAVS
ncbi:MAG TPA: amidase [Acidimicrobiales bacterium]|nr:amidase [Acidimicrobiales bacterium]